MKEGWIAKWVLTVGVMWTRFGGWCSWSLCLLFMAISVSSSNSQALRLMVGVQVTEEQLESIADRTVQEADEDGDGAVSFLEFAKVRVPSGLGS